MSRIGALAASAATTFDLAYLPMFLQVGDPDDATVFDGLNVVVDGNPIIQLNDGAQIRVLMLLESDGILAGANSELSSRLMLCDGKLGKPSSVTIGNAGVTTPDVFQNSLGKSSGAIRKVAVQPCVAEGNLTVIDFDVLYFLPTNFARAQVTYMNGFTEELTAPELQANYLAQFPSEAAGLVNGFVVVPGMRGRMGQQVRSIELFANALGNLNVVVSKWQIL